MGYNILTVITLGFAFAYAQAKKEAWMCKHRVYDGKRLKFNGTGMSLFGTYIKWMLLTIVTIGIYGFWIPVKMLKWKATRTELSEADEQINEPNI